MFADPFSNLMLVILLFFAGLLIMFIFVMRSIESGRRSQEEAHRQLESSLSELDRKFRELNYTVYNMISEDTLVLGVDDSESATDVIEDVAEDLTVVSAPEVVVEAEDTVTEGLTSVFAPEVVVEEEASAEGAVMNEPAVVAEPAADTVADEVVTDVVEDLPAAAATEAVTIDYSRAFEDESLPDVLAGLAEEPDAGFTLDPAAASFVGERRLSRRMVKK
ncbi:MAG: hypothetical protein LBV80_05075 [Deltaproteobacteria bacterium]|nr:hypothetical protein [Deltaproteobacteria bacterium]